MRRVVRRRYMSPAACHYRARIVKELLVEALARHAARERRQRLARDYAAGRADARALLNGLEVGQLDLLGDEDA